MNDEKMRQLELHTLYLRNMQRIKRRMRAISDVWTGQLTTTYKQTNIEFCVLQIRKILELIALSSLVSDTDIYKEKLDNIEKMWNARIIFRDIERIHPDFYPCPIQIDKDNISEWNDQHKPYLTRAEFVRVYERCGKFLHEDSSYKTDKQIQEEYEAVWKDIGYWGELITNLLSNHVVHLYNQKDLFFISMNKDDGPPHGNIFTRVMEEHFNGQNENGVR